MECHQCGNSDMRLTNLDLEKYSSMSEEERADYSDAWLYIHKPKGLRLWQIIRIAAKRRKKKKSRKLLLFVFEVLLLAVLLLVAYFVSMMNRIKYENLDESEAGINSDLDAKYDSFAGRIYEYRFVWSGQSKLEQL